MEIKTKNKLGDTIWIMNNNKPEKMEISSIKIEVYSEETIIVYEISTSAGKVFANVSENNGFYQTKEELIKSL